MLFDYSKAPTATREQIRIRISVGKAWMESKNPVTWWAAAKDAIPASCSSHGAVSLLVETMWSGPEWFNTRDRAADYRQTIDQVNELRRALDIIETQPGVDKLKIAFVGHHFGAMFGEVLASVDGRPCGYACQAGTSAWSKWYLY